MSVDLNKCKRGDKLERLDGDFMTYVQKSDAGWHILLYESGNEALYTDKGACNFDTGRTWPCDIIRIVGQPSAKPRKVARCYVEKDASINAGRATVRFAGFTWIQYYANRRNAIRGARRFCAAIWHECVIVDETKGGEK